MSAMSHPFLTLAAALLGIAPFIGVYLLLHWLCRRLGRPTRGLDTVALLSNIPMLILLGANLLIWDSMPTRDFYTLFTPVALASALGIAIMVAYFLLTLRRSQERQSEEASACSAEEEQLDEEEVLPEQPEEAAQPESKPEEQGERRKQEEMRSPRPSEYATRLE